MKAFRLLILLPLVAAAFSAVPAGPVQAVWPGVNGDIVFQSFRNADYEIYVMHANGSTPTRLTNNTDNDSGPKWSPNAPTIVFSSDRTGNGDIYSMDSTGGSVVQLTNTPAGEYSPAYSPDGSKIAYTRSSGSGDQIWVMTSAGANAHRITNPSSGNDAEPVWSPDGKHIAFYHDHKGHGIYTVSPSGKTRFQVTKGKDYDPDWSPTGNRLVFARYDGLTNNPVMTVKPNGSGILQVTPNGQRFYDPGYSPDGTRILIAGGGSPYSIYSIPPGGGATTQLTFGTDDLEPDEGRV